MSEPEEDLIAVWRPDGHSTLRLDFKSVCLAGLEEEVSELHLDIGRRGTGPGCPVFIIYHESTDMFEPVVRRGHVLTSMDRSRMTFMGEYELPF